MPTVPPPRHLCRLIAVFWVVLLCIPAFQMVLHPFPDGSFLSENRAKAPSPLAENGLVRNISVFPAAFDRYFSDSFGFRDALVGAQTSILYQLLRTSPTPSVVLGNEGWLYYNSATDGGNLRDYCGLQPFSAPELDTIERKLTGFARYLRERGIFFALLIAPSKHTIYPEHLPKRIRVLGGESRLDQLASRLAIHSDILFVDPRRALIAGRSWSQLYFKTDTHWNSSGAFVAFTELMKALQLTGVGVTVPKLKDFQLKQEAPTLRDLGRMLGASRVETEADLMPVRLVQQQVRMVSFPMEPGGDPSLVTVACETDDPGRPRVLMLVDSFATFLQPLLCPEWFRSTYYPRFSVDSATIDELRPAIFAIEITERHLGFLLDAKLPQD